MKIDMPTLEDLKRIPKDKVMHAAGGLLVAAFSGVLATVLLSIGLPPVATTVAVASLAAAIAVEAAQWAANRAAREAGSTVVHDVSAMDALASAAPGLLGAIFLFIAGR